MYQYVLTFNMQHFKDTSGEIIYETNWAYTDSIEINNLPITYKGLSIVTSSAPILFYNDNNEVVGHVTPVAGVGTIESVPTGATKLSFSLRIIDIDSFSITYKLFELNPPVSGDWSTWTGKSLIMFGDSLVAGQADDSSEGGAYARRLKDILNLAIATNYGISGRPITNGTPNGAGTNTTVKQVSDYLNYDIVIIAGGTNDFKLNVEIGSIDNIGSENFNANTFYGAIQDIIEYIISSNPHIRLCFWTPLKRTQSGYNDTYTNLAGYKLIDYVNAIKSCCILYGIPVVDLYSISGINAKTIPTFAPDGLHLNGAGYDYVTNIAAKQVNCI